MIVRNLSLHSFRRFKEEKIDFRTRLNVFVGVNGAGKSTILHALSILLSWYAKRVISPQANGSGIVLSQSMIRHGDSYASIAMETENFGEVFSWSLCKGAKGGKAFDVKSDLSQLTNHVKVRRQTPGFASHAPILVWYTVNRALLEFPRRIRSHHEFVPLTAYEEALGGRLDFKLFFEWFRLMQEKENEILAERFRNGERCLGEECLRAPGSPLELLTRALSAFLPEFTNWRVKFQPMRFCVEKDGEPFDISDLSDGEKNVIALVGDIVRRLVQANPGDPEALSGNGVVMIDEVELHLHPAWQSTILPRLLRTFPGIQFVVTTHSPLVLTQLNALLFAEKQEAGEGGKGTIAVWQLEKDSISSLLDGETGLILPNAMDEAIVQVDDEFDRLLEEENSSDGTN